MTAMTILLLDPRWPTMIPMEARGHILAPISFADDVPVSVRWNFDDHVDGEDPAGVGTLVTFAAPPAADGRRVIRAASLDDPIDVARRIMAVARSRGEWEAGQTHESLLVYLDEEVAEFADAVRGGASDDDMKKELGDLLLQVLFHAEIASRRGAFDLDEVAQSFVDKMRSRAPYFFDGSTGPVHLDRQNKAWAAGKRAERL